MASWGEWLQGPAQRSALRSAVADRQWPQARLLQAKLVTSANCRLCVAFGLCDCMDPDPKHRGTLVHRLWICPVLHATRLQAVPGWLIREARSKIAVDGTMHAADRLLYTRALMRSLVPQVPRQPPQETFQWVVAPPRNFDPLDCTFYLDGSFLYSEARYAGLASRKGWAFAVYNAEDELVALANGRPPGWTQGIHGAELWSLYQALQLGQMQCTFLTDCKAVLLGAHRGLAWANDTRRVHGRVWGAVALALEDRQNALAWTPAHCTGAQVAGKKLSDGTPMRQKHRIGNAEVDRLAKAAAQADALPYQTRRRIEVRSDKLTSIALWIGR